MKYTLIHDLTIDEYILFNENNESSMEWKPSLEMLIGTPFEPYKEGMAECWRSPEALVAERDSYISYIFTSDDLASLPSTHPELFI